MDTTSAFNWGKHLFFMSIVSLRALLPIKVRPFPFDIHPLLIHSIFTTCSPLDLVLHHSLVAADQTRQAKCSLSPKIPPCPDLCPNTTPQSSYGSHGFMQSPTPAFTTPCCIGPHTTTCGMYLFSHHLPFLQECQFCGTRD